MGANVHHSKSWLSPLIQQAEGGEDFIIAREDEPDGNLVPVLEKPEEGYRILGRLKGRFGSPLANWEEKCALIDKELEQLMNDEPLISGPPPGMDGWGNPVE